MSIDEWIRNREVHGQISFTIDNVHQAFAERSAKMVKKELSRLIANGRILSVYRGFYVIIPVQYQLKRIVPPSYYIDELMQYVGKPYYVGLLSAAAIYGATHQRAMQLQVMTIAPRIKASNKNPLLDWNYRTKIPASLLITKNGEMGIIRYSSAELTAIDLVQFADHVGGYSRAATVLVELIDSIDIAKLSQVFPYTTTATLQRFGYLLEFVLQEQEKADDFFLLFKEQTLHYHSILMNNNQPHNQNADSNRWHVNMNISIELDDL